MGCLLIYIPNDRLMLLQAEGVKNWFFGEDLVSVIVEIRRQRWVLLWAKMDIGHIASQSVKR